jgi:NDP-sugar pyrophosphorylase family protein
MKAMIFAAGMGTRLKPLTDTVPKALIPIKGEPMLGRLIRNMKAIGCREVVINIHHLGEQIIDYLRANNNFGITIHISDERNYLLDTGGGLKQAAYYLQGSEPFLVHNVDILTDVDLKAFYDSHRLPNATATLLVSRRSTSRYLLFDKNNKLCGWRNRDTGEVKSHFPNFDPGQYNEYAFNGIHVISPEIFELMDEWTGKFSIIDFYLSICAKANIYSCPTDNITLIDIGKPESIEKAETWLKPKK